jgi:hypothetical protein
MLDVRCFPVASHRVGDRHSVPISQPEKKWFAFPLESHKPTARVQRIFSFLLLLFLPLAALADSMVIPTVAYPAKITIPDQRALICYTNGTERLVIETRFTGAGTNFAWVVPLPGQPVIEEATTGLFPTLQYLFRPKIVHDVPRYWLGILITMGLIYLFRFVLKHASNGFVFLLYLLLVFFAALVLPALSSAKTKGMASGSSAQAVSILDRKLVGIFETTTITSRDAKALQTWLSKNGFAVPTNAESVIASYVKDGWVFVATKVRRDQPDNETSTPHPLSFTFKTDKPVYPMRLTGVDNGSLSVELYVFGPSRAEASLFKVERCIRPNHTSETEKRSRWSPETLVIVHPLLREWADGSPAATKLTATLSPADMRKDVWINWTPFWESGNRLYSWQGALTTALNWGAGFFAAGLVLVCLLAFATETHKTKLPRRVGIVTVVSLVLAGLSYFIVPKIEVKLVKGGYYSEILSQQLVLNLALNAGNWRTIAEARAGLRELISDTNNAVSYGCKDWDNYLVGGQIREEDSPGNYLLRETNHQVQIVTFSWDARDLGN